MTLADAGGLVQQAHALAPHLAPALVQWQQAQGRHHLPWQNTRDPYRVWLSEIMLQQTQVSTVLGYYDRFLQRYPSVESLAAAPLDDVLTLWAGLGYYSRARNLHRCAQVVVAAHGGRFPQTADMLAQLPGIGPSTASAVASFCFGERVSIMDGNVKRVLTRVLAWPADMAQARHEKTLWQAAHALLPTDASDMPAYTQGLMDLGATLCQRSKPNCPRCPWLPWCAAQGEGQPEAYPVKTKKLKRSQRESWCLWLQHGQSVWLVQRPGTGIWAGLWTVPMFDTEAEMLHAVQQLSSMQPLPRQAQPFVKHALTHLDWRLHLSRVALPDPVPQPTSQGQWVPMDALHQFGLPTPFKRWLVG
jgi:A/G-specific adenine glycosylase